MKKWLFHLTFALWYPAVLGAFIVAALGGDGAGVASIWWTVILLVYFSVQHAEGMLAGEGRKGRQYLGDLAALITMIACFAKLYPVFLPEPAKMVTGISFAWLAAAVFFVPPAARVLFEPETLKKPVARGADHSGFHRSLTGLSIVAVAACVIFALAPAAEGIALAIVGAALVVYLGAFVFGNEHVGDRFKRPSPAPR